MAEGRAGEYFPGDEIKLRVSMTSSSAIVAVEAIYAHQEYPWITLSLQGSTELEPNSPTAGSRKRSVATLSCAVEGQHEPGLYEAARVIFYTFSGYSIEYDRAGKLSETPGVQSDEGTFAYELHADSWPPLALNPEPFRVLEMHAEIVEETAEDVEP